MSAQPVPANIDVATEAIDPKVFRAAAGNFITGVTIATTIAEDGKPRGITVNSFTTVSLSPPLVLFCVGQSSRSFTAFNGAQSFAINILSSGQRQLSLTFGSKVEDKFVGQDWISGRSGSPIFADSLSSFDCVLHDRIEAGDHIVLIGRVIDTRRASGTPLGYFSGNYIDFDMQRETAETSNAAGHHRFGGLFHHAGSLLFLEDEGKLVLPFAQSLGEDARESDSLLGRLDALGVNARLSFVYSVFSEKGHDGLSMVYLGEIDQIEEPSRPGFQLLRPEEIPFERIGQFSGLVQRYIRERAEDTFGLYVGTAIKGSVHRSR